MMRQRWVWTLLAAATLMAGLPTTAAQATTQEVLGARYNVIDYRSTNLSWLATPDAQGYAFFVNGIRTPVSASTGMQVDVILGRLLGPADVVEVAAIYSEGQVGPRARAEYWSWQFVQFIPMSLNFPEGGTRLSSDSVAKVREFAAIVKRHGFTQVIATGHDAGSTPSPTGYRLGQARARSALNALQRLVDVDGTVSSWGNSVPMFSNGSAAGRAANRRVEFGVR